MKRLRRLTVWLCVIFFVLITGVLALGRVISPAPVFPFDERYMPGMPVPDLPADCYWEEYGYGYNTCSAKRTPVIYYDRQSTDGTIHDVLFETPGNTLGDFINTWGVPIAANYWLHGGQIWWRGGYSAWVFDKFSPNAAVEFVEIDPHETPYDATPWHGFQNYQPTSNLPGMP